MYRVTYQIGVLAAIALMSGCSGDQAQEQRRNEAYQYLPHDEHGYSGGQ